MKNITLYLEYMFVSESEGTFTPSQLKILVTSHQHLHLWLIIKPNLDLLEHIFSYQKWKYNIDPLDQWESQESVLNKNIFSLVVQLFPARASTAGIETIFSTFGLVNSILRNRLHIEKAAKLVFLFCIS